MTCNINYNKAIEELSIASNALFSTAFNDRPDRAQFLIKDILDYLGIKDFEILTSKTQEVHNHLLKHVIIADVEIFLEDGTQITEEIQINNPDQFPPERARYIFSSADTSFLDQGKSYQDLPLHIQIVISKKDLLGTGLPIVSIERFINETGEKFPDKQILVYINSASKTDEDTPFNHFLDDLFETDYHKVHSPIAKEILQTYKETKEGKIMLEGYLKEVFEEQNKDIIAQFKDLSIKFNDISIKYRDISAQNQDIIKENMEIKELLEQKNKENAELRKKLAEIESK